MTGRERRLLRMLCMTASGGGGGGDKPWEEMTWDDVIAATKNGKYKDFEIGATKELDLGSEGIVHMQIVGIDVDDLADGSGKAPLTFISKELLNTKHRMNPRYDSGQAGTGTVGGWEKCEMRTYLQETIKPMIPENVRNAIMDVTKYSNSYNTSGAGIKNSITVDDIWIPSDREIFGGTSYETLGHVYSDVFTNAESRKKYKVEASSAEPWWLRSAYNVSSFCYVYNNGNSDYNATYVARAIALGFCL